jgi:DNA-binding CsgD family transcriptional regulator/tetratricopeptide (TPR) repeat protein
LRGRRTECAVLDGMLAAVREGEGRALVVRGEAGVGKTALLEYVVEVAADLKVIRAAGVESEMALPFAGLHQLCAPMLGRVAGLPRPQRQALEIVFGSKAERPADRFLVGLAVLSLLSEVAQECPLVCVVDDAQWLDEASALTLAFVARRLGADSIALLFAVREVGEDLRGLPELTVEGLGDDDAHALLSSALRFVLDERVRDRIVADTRGNPLALLELPRGLTASQLAGGFGLLGPQELSGRIEASFQRRLAALPLETQRLMLVAAAEPVGDPVLVWGAAQRLEISISAAGAAQREGLMTIGERVAFRHPLVRSAVYGAASARARREVHLALAEVTDATVDPDRRAWHLAAAAAGPDEEVASELERSAGRAQARGGLAAAAAFHERAAELTEDPARRADRALAAAQVSLQAGAFEAALGQLTVAEAGSLDELQQAQIDLLRGQIAFVSRLGNDAPPLLLKAAKRLEPLDLELARETYLSAWGAAAFAKRADAGYLPDICRAARALPPPPQPSRPEDVLLDGLALLIADGRAAAAPTLRQVVRIFTSQETSVEVLLRWGWLATAASNAMWDDDGTRAISGRQIQLVRDAGALEGLAFHLVALGVPTAWSGDFAAAAALIAEGDEVTAATGAHIPPFAALQLVALRGRETDASALIEATLKEAAESGPGVATTEARRAASILYNGLGRYEEALAAAVQASWDPLNLYPSMWGLPELVEAAIRCGQVEIARNALDRLAGTTQPAGTDFGLGIEARSRALVSDGEVAERLYCEAIDRLSRTQLRPELARAHLVYGEWLRREGRQTDARAQLRTAHEMLLTTGMEAFAERARRELLTTGERVRKRAVETRDDLTAKERQIARLARDGLSNPEIGARLFLSPRTVEWHLGKVFAKLRIRSRGELARALTDSGTDDPASPAPSDERQRDAAGVDARGGEECSVQREAAAAAGEQGTEDRDSEGAAGLAEGVKDT